MMIIRSAQIPTIASCANDDFSPADPLGQRAVTVFAAELAADRIPSIRAIRTELHVGQPRAQRLRAYLAAVAIPDGEILAGVTAI